MLATITDIQKDEVSDVVKTIERCHGTVVSRFVNPSTAVVVLCVRFEKQDVNQADIVLCDLGYTVDWID